MCAAGKQYGELMSRTQGNSKELSEGPRKIRCELSAVIQREVISPHLSQSIRNQ